MTAAEELALFIESVQDYAIYVLDGEGRVASWNLGARRIKGYETDEIVGQHFSCFYTPEECAAGRPQQVLAEAAQKGRCETEGWRVRKDGSRFWAHVVITALRDGQGRARFGKVTRDLTRQRQHEETALRLVAEQARREALSHNERWLKTTLRSIGDAVIATDATGRVVFMNHVAERLTGWEEGLARGVPLQQVFSIVHEETRAIVESPVDRVLREGVVVGLANHTVLIRRGGGEVPIDDSGAPIRDEAGSLLGVVLVFRDVSERRQIENELARQHQEVLRSLEEARVARRMAEAATDRLSFLAEAGLLLNASLDYEVTLRNVADLVVPQLADWCSVDIVDPGAQQHHNVVVAHADPAKVAMAEELRRRYPPDPDGPRGAHAVIRTGKSELYPDIPDELLVASAKDEDHLRILRSVGMSSAMAVPISSRGRVLGALTFIREQARQPFTAEDLALAEELGRRAGGAVENARIYRQVEELNRLKDDFLATLSHELRTPLTAILGWTGLLRRGKLEPQAAERAVTTIDRNARLQAQLINDVLDVSAIVAGKLQVELRPLDLVETIRASVETVRPQAEAKGLELSSHSEEESMVTMGDEARLQQVIANLLSNAVKFTPSGGHVSITLDEVEGQARVRVADTGAGIPKSFLPHLFERFRQADSSTRRRHGGLGIGLSIARYLVEGHGGRIEAESTGEGEGACFTVLLPLRLAPPPTLTEEAESSSLLGVRVLTVDDDADTRALLVALFERCGAEVQTASSASEALEVLARWSPHLLVSDLGMPGMDGYELIRKIREGGGEGSRLPAIALTAYAGREDHLRALQAGYHKHLPKPVDPDLLIDLAAQLTTRGR
jgi:PAS domain S-box-containing protein